MRPQMRRAGRALLLCRRPVDFPFGPRPVRRWAPMLLCQPSLGYHPPVGRHCANRHVCRPPPTPLHFPLPLLDRRRGARKKICPPSPTCGRATVIAVGATVTAIAVVASHQNFFEFLIDVLKVGVLEPPQGPPCVAPPVQPLDVDCRHPTQVAAAFASVRRRRCPLRQWGLFIAIRWYCDRRTRYRRYTDWMSTALDSRVLPSPRKRCRLFQALRRIRRVASSVSWSTAARNTPSAQMPIPKDGAKEDRLRLSLRSCRPSGRRPPTFAWKATAARSFNS
mmetsp:Transcript_30059/g.59463  ORF Transcript_30059/g.59463 Transcript_30059/m.59463 type:complete len:279 (-) Transcript_30059:820-1656(-)